METFGSSPQVNRMPEGPGIKRLFYSRREQALIKDKTIRKGYGYLTAGTILTVAGPTSKDLVPYVPFADDLTNALGVPKAFVRSSANGTYGASSFPEGSATVRIVPAVRYP